MTVRVELTSPSRHPLAGQTMTGADMVIQVLADEGVLLVDDGGIEPGRHLLQVGGLSVGGGPLEGSARFGDPSLCRVSNTQVVPPAGIARIAPEAVLELRNRVGPPPLLGMKEPE